MNDKQLKRRRKKSEGPFLVYCLVFTGGNKDRTYIGQTNQFERRLRQHRKEISGGARYTSMVVNESPEGTWMPLFQVIGFDKLRPTLQFELAMKRRKVPVSFFPAASGGGKKEQKGDFSTHPFPTPPALASRGRGRGTRGAAKKAYTRGPSGKIRQLEYLLHLGKLNDEPHSPFARNGLAVRLFISKEEYCKRAGMTEEIFDLLRRKQGVPFTFISPAAGHYE